MASPDIGSRCSAGGQKTSPVEDPDLLDKLATESLQAAADELAIRWKWAEARLDVDWSDLARFGRINPQPAQPTGEEKAESERLRTRHDQLAEMDDDAWTEELVAEADTIETRLEEIEAAVEARATFRHEDFAIAGCIATIGRDGKLQVVQGLVRPKDMPAQEPSKANAAGQDDDGSDEAGIPGIEAPTISAPAMPPARPDAEAEARKEAGVGIGLGDDLRAIRTALVKAHLAEDFGASFDLMLFQMGRAVFTPGYHAHALDIAIRETPDRPPLRANDDAFAAMSPGEAMLADRSSLPFDWLAIEDDGEAFAALRALPEAGKQSLFAACAARTVKGQLAFEHGARPELEATVARLGIDFAAHVRPTAELFWSRLRKDRMLAVARDTGRSRRVLKITDARGERLALRSRPASANLAETAAFMDGSKRILVFSMAGGTGRSYHADLGCANTARRVHYLLEPGWRADQAIQGLGRTHRTHQASAPLFRPVTTDVKGERRFIATIARRLDSLGAITRGQRDSQTAMGGDDTALFRASDNLESLYAKSALRQFYIALWRGHIEGWSLDRFEEATGLKLTWEGSLKEDLPPMPKFLNRLLALPISEQNALFAALEARIEANIEHAIEAGTFERGVETIAADSLSTGARETVFVHEASGAETELVEVLRRDRLEPLTAGAALKLHAEASGRKPRLMVNGQSKRAALVRPASSRMFDDGGVQERVRLVRPAARDTMARDALDASQWRDAEEDRWRAFWEAEVAGLPSHTESRFWLVAGLLLPIWDRLPDESMRVRRLMTDNGEHLIGRVLGPAEAEAFRAAFGLAGGPGLTAAEIHDEVMLHGQSFPLAQGWRLARRRLMGADRIEIEGPADGDAALLKRMGCIAEIVSWRTRLFAPDTAVLERIVERWPIAAPDAARPGARNNFLSGLKVRDEGARTC